MEIKIHLTVLEYATVQNVHMFDKELHISWQNKV
jgi:hypothetical protein